ncbi:MAG: hypothetical protein NVSMB4_05030 [Acidimicrobiales bacterium]
MTILDLQSHLESRARRSSPSERGGADARPAAAASPAQRRNPTLDAMRGIFILSMTAGHLASGTDVDRWAHPLVWVDGAAGFVLFSGLVLGMQQRRMVERTGPVSGRRWLVRRAWFIFVVHVLLTMAALTLRTVTGRPAFLPPMDRFGGPLGSFVGVITLRVQPDFCNVLPLYVVLLLVSVGIVELLRRGHNIACVGLSVSLYVAAQVDPHIVFMADLSVGANTWSWGAWQVLFVAGMVTGWHWERVSRTLRAFRRSLLVVAGVVTAALVVIGNLVASRSWPFGGGTSWADLLFAKYELRPGVPVYLAAATVVTYVGLRRLANCRGGRSVTSVLSRIGSRSLDCFIMLSLVQLCVFTVLPADRPDSLDLALVAVSALGYWVLATVRLRGRGLRPGLARPAPRDAGRSVDVLAA